MSQPAWYLPSFTRFLSLRWCFFLFWTLVAVLCLWGIWGGSLSTWDEALTAERAREMFRQGWSMTVHKCGQPDFNKPPLYYWMAAAGFWVFGLGEFAARLPSALMGLACMVVVYRLARGYGADTLGGLLAVSLLAANASWVNLSREALLDSGMTLSMLLSLWAYAFHPRPTRGAILAGISLAFGFWLKNPSVLMILPAMFAHSWTGGRRDYRRLLMVAAVAFALGSIWYVHQYLVWGERFSDFFFNYNVAKRFTEDFEGHRSQWYFYLSDMYKYAPHMLILAGSLLAALVMRQYSPSLGVIVQLCSIVPWIAAIHVMHSKRHPYIIPAYPFLAVAGSELLTSMAGRFRNSRNARIALHAFLLFALAVFASRYDWKMSNNHALKDAVRFMAQNCTDDARFTLNVPAHVVSFYSDAVVDGLDKSAAQPQSSAACVLYNTKNSAHLPDVLSNATCIWGIQDHLGVWRIAGGAPAQGSTP